MKRQNLKILLLALVLVVTAAGVSISINGVPVLTQNQNGSYSIKATFASAVSSGGAAKQTIYVMGYTPITGTTTVPATKAVEVKFGGYFSGTGSLVFNGPFECGAWQAFANSGTVTGLKRSRPDWFGTNTTPGVTDMTAAVNAALANGGVVRIPADTWLVSGVSAAVPKTEIIMDKGVILKLKAASNAPVISVTADDVTVTGGEIDGNAANQTRQNYSAPAIRYLSADNGNVHDVYIHDTAGNGVYGQDSQDLKVQFNRIINTDLQAIFIKAQSGVTVYNPDASHNIIDRSMSAYHLPAILIQRDTGGTIKKAISNGNKITLTTTALVADDIGIGIRADDYVANDNVISGGFMSLSIDRSTGGSGTGNMLSGATWGAEFAASSNCSLSGGSINAITYGVVIDGTDADSTDNSITGVNIKAGVTAVFGSMSPGFRMDRTSVTGCPITVNSAVANAVYLKYGDNCTITGNPMKNLVAGGTAVFLDRADIAVVNSNSFLGFTVGVQAYDVAANPQTYTLVHGNYVPNGNVFTLAGARTFGAGCRQQGNTGSSHYFDILDMQTNVRHIRSTGSPEGVYAAGIGSIYHRTNGTSDTALYVKESGTGNTGWDAIKSVTP